MAEHICDGQWRYYCEACSGLPEAGEKPMTDQDNLRDRIAHLLHGHFELTAIGPVGCGHEHRSDEEHIAQAIIDDLGLTVETKIDKPGQRGINPVHRIVGKWER